MGQGETLSEISERWLREGVGAFSAETAEHYAWIIAHQLVPGFGDRTDISREEALGFAERLRAEGQAESTVYKCLTLLERILAYGAAQALCPLPDWQLDLSRPERMRKNAVLTPSDEQELTRFLTENPTPAHLGIFLILTCGISVGEALAIRWKDVSVNKGQIRVYISRGPLHRRENRTRTVEIGERQRLYLRKIMGPGECYLCSGTPEPLQRTSLENRWRTLIRQLMLPPLPLTNLRHTYGVRCLETGMDFQTLAEKLGVRNSSEFRAQYKDLVSLEAARRRPEAPRGQATKETPSVRELARKVDERKKRLQQTLDCLEADEKIIQSLRYSDCVQGATRQGLYNLIEKVLEGDKDGQYLVEYLRCNMRVAEMPLLKVTTPQAIRRRVTHGWEKLQARLEALYSAAGVSAAAGASSAATASAAASSGTASAPATSSGTSL